MTLLILILMFIATSVTPLKAYNAKMSVYRDSRGSTTANFMANQPNVIRDGWLGYFGFVDIERGSYYTEHQIYPKGISEKWFSISPQIEYSDSPLGDIFRGGPRLVLNLPNGFVSFHHYPIQSRSGSQIGTQFNILLYPRVALAGFWEYEFSTFGGGNVTEPEIQFQILKHLWIVYEFRYNEFLEKTTGSAAGITISF